MEEKEAELLREPSATFGGEGEALELHEKEMFSEFVGSCRISTIESLSKPGHESNWCCCKSLTVSNSSLHPEQYDSETIFHEYNLPAYNNLQQFTSVYAFTQGSKLDQGDSKTYFWLNLWDPREQVLQDLSYNW